jgi:hypothetical protein
MSPSPTVEPAPVKEPTTKPAEPGTAPTPDKGDDPWNVPEPSVEPTPKA